jgi:hypothetical protein
MTAVKLGAFDFIEKPLSLDLLLQTIRRALNQQKEWVTTKPVEENALQQTLFPRGTGEEMVNQPPTPLRLPTFLSEETSKGKGASLFPQRTIKKSVVLYGTGLHSGMKTGLLFQPLPPNSGILFGSVSSDEVVPAHLDFVQTTEFATSLKKGRAIAKTVEHLMAVLHAYNINNLMIKKIEENTIMDGPLSNSARSWRKPGSRSRRRGGLIINRRLEVI